MKYGLKFILILATVVVGKTKVFASFEDSMLVRRTTDFTVTGGGESEQWKKAAWNILAQRRDTLNKRDTRVKTLYSDKGIYFLFNNQDEFLTASKTDDFDNLWLEDVNEVFLWPDTTNTIYFEYEISPLNKELPILIPNINGKFWGWRPWVYTNNRKVKHETKIWGGDKKTGSKIRSWTSEFFIPFELLVPLANVPPKQGVTWKANMYRVDYDHNRNATWSWRKVDGSFHQFSGFGRLVFE